MRSEAAADFRERVAPRDLPEWMDGQCSYEEFRDCLISLEQVNRWLFGYRPTLAWLGRLVCKPAEPIHIVDVGCGGGDTLRQIARWAGKRGLSAKLTGIDLNPYAIRAAQEFTPKELDIRWITGNAFHCRTEEPIHIVVSSLMTHHLESDEIVRFLEWMDATAQVGWFINDLQRSAWNARLFGMLAKVVRWHRFVQHDGPVSFRRAFSKQDWECLLSVAGIQRSTVSVEPWHPGRLCVGKVKPC